MTIDTHLSRRSLIKAGLASLVLSAVPSLAVSSFTPPVRSLAFYNTHTGETLKQVYWEKGFYIVESLKEINHVLRDHRTNEIKPIDTSLLDLLHAVHSKMESSQPFTVISGYRSPRSNMQLYEHSSGVAFKSLHMEGKAIDIRLPDRSLKAVRASAMQMQQGGVGYYQASDFVHMDTGAVRYW